MKKQYDRESAVRLLVNMRAALLARGENRYPQRDDFSPEQVVAIKAFLGPWPRALEAAGIKPPRDPAFREKQLQKRIAQRAPVRRGLASVNRERLLRMRSGSFSNTALL